MKPLLKYAGSKAKLVGRIAAAFGGKCEQVYFEPFLGSGAAYLGLLTTGHLELKMAVLADVNRSLVAFHLAVRDQVDEVLHELDSLPTSDWHERYYEVRSEYNLAQKAGPLHAARFAWLNHHCFNGLYRENRAGEFNVPCGRYSAPKVPDRERFMQVSAALKYATIVVASYSDVISTAGPGDQVYCDPPYVPISKSSSFTSYSSGGFTMDDQRDLAVAAASAAERGARVVLSNHDLPLVSGELYPESSGFSLERFSVRRSISSGKRGSVGEVLASIGPVVATVS